jgi:hypothetical protein
MGIADVKPPAQNCSGSPADGQGTIKERPAPLAGSGREVSLIGFADVIEAEGGAQCATADTRPLPGSHLAEFEAARRAMLRAWYRCCGAGLEQRDEPGATASAMRQIADELGG